MSNPSKESMTEFTQKFQESCELSAKVVQCLKEGKCMTAKRVAIALDANLAKMKKIAINACED